MFCCNFIYLLFSVNNLPSSSTTTSASHVLVLKTINRLKPHPSNLKMTEAAKRFVPGAPPPAPVSKTQKKKRKAGRKGDEDSADVHVVIPDAHGAALVDKAPEQAEIKAGAIASELVADADHASSPDGATAKPSSAVVEMLNKRIKYLSKKIVRLSQPHLFSDGLSLLRPSVLDRRHVLKTLCCRVAFMPTATNQRRNSTKIRRKQWSRCLASRSR